MALNYLNTGVAPQAQITSGPVQMTATQGMPNYATANINAYGQPSATTGGTPSSTGSGSGFNLDSILGSTLGTAANIWGGQSAAEAATQANLNAINTQQTTMGNVSDVYAGQAALGNGAFDTLGSTLGTNGKPADYSNFLNMPGYQFAVDQGTQAIKRAAAAQGSAFTPNTLNNIGQYVTGTAMGDYNTYVQQLMGAAGLGAQANQGKASAFLGTGANISQLQANIGQNQAGAAASTGSALGSFLGGTNGSGLVGQIGSTVGKQIGNGISNYLTGGSGFTANPGITGAGGAADAASIAGGWAADQGAIDSAYAGIDATTGLSTASTASDIAAANSAWLGGGAADAGAAAGTAAGAGAGAAGAGAAAGDVAMAPVGVDAATADAGVTGLGADAGAGSGGGLGAGAGAVAALAPLAITAELAMHTGPYSLGADYWNKYTNPTGSYGGSGNYTQNFLELANGINQGDIPPSNILAQYPGLYQAAAQMNKAKSNPMSDYYGTGGFGNIPRQSGRM